MVFVVSLNFEKFFEMTVNGIDRWFIQFNRRKYFYYSQTFSKRNAEKKSFILNYLSMFDIL